MALILLRHTTPKIAAGICYGRTDLDVADTFLVEAERAYNALPKLDHIVTSPLTRCRRLANYVSERLRLPLEVDHRVREMDFGSWEGQAWSAIPRHELDKWASDFYHARPHGGESVAMLHKRTMEALTCWNQADRIGLMVTHAGGIRAALSRGETAGDFQTNVDFGAFVSISSPEGAPNE
ncbi:MAG: alpha-ribazole phosphatase family protein [Henriciella sp.]|nr:alpha-ribazole phosphatase family protein [Henriciella sp.]